MSSLQSTPLTVRQAGRGKAGDGIPFSRLVQAELRKLTDTRASRLLLVAMAAATPVIIAVMLIVASPRDLNYTRLVDFTQTPQKFLLPALAILVVTSEWSQRTGLTSFTLVPHRGRVIRAKLTVALGVGVVSMLLAFGVGALGNLLGAAIAGVDPVWDIGVGDFAGLILFQILNMLIGFMLGVLLRNSAGAIVGYFVYSFVLVAITSALAATQDWFERLQPWVDFNFSQGYLTDASSMTAQNWAQLGVTGLCWLVVPLAIGLVAVFRSEVK